MAEQKDARSSSLTRTPKLQLIAKQPLTGECWIPPKKDTPRPRAKEKPQQDSRRGEITFRIKPHTPQQSNAQNSPSKASTVRELRTSRCLSWIQKKQRNQRSNCQHLLDHRKSKRVPEKTYTSALLTMPKPFTVWITTNCEKFLKRWE